MKPMHIDFASPGWRRAWHRLTPAMLALGLAGSALCVAAAWLAVQASERQALREQAIAAMQRRHAAAARPLAPARESVIAPAQAAAVNAAIEQLNLPWRTLQDAVAAANTPGIALLALDPDARRQRLKISAEAKNSDEMVAYISQLKQQELFSDATLLHHEINDQDPNRPLRFQAEVQWRAR